MSKERGRREKVKEKRLMSHKSQWNLPGNAGLWGVWARYWTIFQCPVQAWSHSISLEIKIQERQIIINGSNLNPLLHAPGKREEGKSKEIFAAHTQAVDFWRHRNPSCPKQHQGNFILCSVGENAEFNILSSAWWLCSKLHSTPQACQQVLSLVESPAWWDLMPTLCLHRPLLTHTAVTFSQALTFQSLVAQWSINWCSCQWNWDAKKMTGSFTGQWKANCKEHSGDTFFHRQWWHEEGKLPKGEVEGSPKVIRKDWEADTPSGSCSPCRQPSWARQELTKTLPSSLGNALYVLLPVAGGRWHRLGQN